LLSNITVLRNDLRVWLAGTDLKKEKTAKTDNWEEEILRLNAEIDQLRVQKWQIIPHLNRAEAELARLNARREALTKMFESEFNLARQLRERLTERQVREITKRFEE
jgi:outer membrane murein-binding lipoprotein Lpp